MVWIDFARTVSMLAVVVLHVAAFALADSKVGTENWWISNGFDSAMRWCVPVFVMISGALLLDPNKQETVGQFYRKRFSKIAIPLLFWTAFYLIWGMHTKTIKGDLLLKTIQGKPYYHLWFLYMIGLLYLVTPFLRKIFSNSSSKERTLFTALSLLLAGLVALYGKVYGPETKLSITFFLSYIGYFFLGQIIRQESTPVQKKSWVAIALISTIATALGCYYWGEHKSSKAGAYFYGYLSITVIPQAIAVFYLLKSVIISEKVAGVVRALSSVSMGVYLIHPVVLYYVKQAGFSHTSASFLVSIPTLSLSVFLISAAFSAVLLKIPVVKRVL